MIKSKKQKKFFFRKSRSSTILNVSRSKEVSKEVWDLSDKKLDFKKKKVESGEKLENDAIPWLMKSIKNLSFLKRDNRTLISLSFLFFTLYMYIFCTIS